MSDSMMADPGGGGGRGSCGAPPSKLHKEGVNAARVHGNTSQFGT